MQDLIPKWLYSHSHYHYLREAIPKRAFYEYRPSGPNLVHKVQRYNRLYAEYRLTPPKAAPGDRVSDEEADSQIGSLRSVRHELTDLDVDVLDILMGIWLDRRRGTEKYVEIDTDHVLHARGLNHKVNGQESNKNAIGRGYTPKQREAVNRSICRLLLLWGDVKVIHSHDRKDFNEESRVLELENSASKWHILSTSLFGFDDESKESIDPRKRQKISYRPGSIFRTFNLYQRMYQPTQIYNYNYAHHWREKRIARYLMWQWRVNQQSELSSLVKGTSSLVNSVVLNLDRGRYNQHEKEDVFDIEAKYRPDGDVPSYSDRERLERTLNRLSADEIIDFWEYREGWKPTWSRKSNWLDLWLNSEVLITPSETITKAYQHDSNGVSNRDEPSSSERSLSVLLSKVKKNHNLTQSEMAEKLDISQPYISSIINERKSPSSSTAENIRRKVSSLRNG